VSAIGLFALKSELDIEPALRQFNSPEYQKKARELLEVTGYRRGQ
jgi:hypothetical protein